MIYLTHSASYTVNRKKTNFTDLTAFVLLKNTDGNFIFFSSRSEATGKRYFSAASAKSKTFIVGSRRTQEKSKESERESKDVKKKETRTKKCVRLL
jgi:hypothetical protein